jgi:hypothetical protein
MEDGRVATLVRHARRIGPFAVLLAAGCSSGGTSTPPAQTSPEPPVDETRATVERLLDLSEVESIVVARGPAFTRQVAVMAGDLTDPELERLVPAVTDAFAPDRLRDDIAASVASEAPVMADEVLTWMEGGANAELAAIVDSYDPPLTMEEFAARLDPEDIREERVRLMADWARVQGAGDFFVLLEQALAEASHTVLAELRPDTQPFTPASGDDLATMRQNSFNAAVVSFLYRFETVPDPLLARATREYATDAGQWYVQAYSLAVARAMRSAARRVVTTLRANDAP